MKTTVNRIREWFGPEEFDRAIKNNHLGFDIDYTKEATLKFEDEDKLGFETYIMEYNNKEILLTKKSKTL